MSARASLTGAWAGAYRYNDNALPETVFNAQIEEIDGVFTGAIQEPNLLRPHLGPLVTADIEGMRTGAQLTFTKFYNGSGGMNHAIRYEGAVDAKFIRIDGVWRIPRDASGTFFMTREDEGAEEAVELELAAPVGGSRDARGASSS